MLPLSVRLVLFVACVVPGVYYLARGELFGVVCLSAALLLAVGYLRYGTVWFAFRAAAQGRLDHAERLLSRTWFPAWLERRHRAYYHWMKGLFAARGQDWLAARQLFAQALEIGPRTPTDRALLLGILGYACAAGGDFIAAREHLAAARSLPQTLATTRVLDQYEQEIEAAAPRSE